MDGKEIYRRVNGPNGIVIVILVKNDYFFFFSFILFLNNIKKNKLQLLYLFSRVSLNIFKYNIYSYLSIFKIHKLDFNL